MVFSSLIFLFLFLPVVLLLHTIGGNKIRNAILLLSSLIFYAWGGVSYSVIMVGSILLNYGIGRWLENRGGTTTGKRILALGVTVNLALLGVFKYAFFITTQLNLGLEAVDLSTIEMNELPLPIGISFFTFQAISYLVDVYRREGPAQRNLPNLGLYISFFPQLIAGPIVRYKQLALQLQKRTISWVKFGTGVERFAIGLAKKVLLANTFAVVADDIFLLPPEHLSTGGAWLGMVAYTLQIYFDFSGYSDMAIGLGRMFGFDLPENFNFPYVARSIRDFWRRWHITLSGWFRDYLYIPLGGNRGRKSRTYFNLFLVFLLTGFWHGASWTFIAWGLLHGLFMILERSGWGRTLDRLPRPVGVVYAVLIAMFAWVLFRAETFEQAGHFYQALLGASQSSVGDAIVQYHLTPEFLFFLGLGTIAATPLLKNLSVKLGQQKGITLKLWHTCSTLFTFGIVFASLLYLAAGTYNPFIYFRF